MIRVGIELHDYWQGGLNYDRNLLRAVLQVPDRQIEPVLLTGTRRPNERALDNFPSIQVLQTPLLDRHSPGWVARKVSQQAVARDPMYQHFLREHDIHLLSHSDALGRSSHIPSTPWIPDFQHMKMPHLFRPWERMYRNRNYRVQVRHSTMVIVSSYTALRDLELFDSDAAARSRVLHFVAQPNVTSRITPLEELERKYGIRPPYLHVPNQFWSHKNHGLIVDALHILKENGEPVTVVATGPTEDYRQPEYFGLLMEKSRSFGIEDLFKVLGLVPFEDLMGIMHHAVAMINPSRFEGWSTSVEEAKSLGKRMILSNIPVHLEQDPPEGIFVDPDNAPDLATAVRQVLREHDADRARTLMQEAERELPHRVRQFGEAYQSILLEAMDQ